MQSEVTASNPVCPAKFIIQDSQDAYWIVYNDKVDKLTWVSGTPNTDIIRNDPDPFQEFKNICVVSVTNSIDNIFVILTAGIVKFVKVGEATAGKYFSLRHLQRISDIDSTAPGLTLDHLACYSSTTCYVYSFGSKVYYHFNPQRERPVFQKGTFPSLPSDINSIHTFARGAFILVVSARRTVVHLCGSKLKDCSVLALTPTELMTIAQITISDAGLSPKYQETSIAVKYQNETIRVFRFLLNYANPTAAQLAANLKPVARITIGTGASLNLLGFTQGEKYLLIAEETTDKLTIYFYEKTPCNPNCLTCSSTSKDHCTSCRPGGVIDAVQRCIFAGYCSELATPGVINNCEECAYKFATLQLAGGSRRILAPAIGKRTLIHSRADHGSE